jgi:hypothetical protein
LRSCLSKTSAVDLKRIAQVWGWKPTGARPPTKADLVAGLSAILRDPMRLWCIMSSLPKPAKGLLWTAASAGGSLLVDRALGIDPPTHVSLRPLDELTGCGLLTVHPDETVPRARELVVVPREIYTQLRTPPAYRNLLGEWLATLPKEDSAAGTNSTTSLWEIARSNQINVRYTQAVLKELIRHTLLNLQYIRELYKGKLSTSGQQLLKILSLRQQPLHLEELRHEWLHFRWSVDILDMTDILNKLQARGLLFINGSGGQGSMRSVVTPRDLAHIIRDNFSHEYRYPCVRRRTFFVRKPHFVLPDSHMEPKMADDMVSLLGYLFSEDVALLASEPDDPLSGRVHRKHWRRLAPQLKYQGEDAIDYLNFLFHFSRCQELITKRDGRLEPVYDNLHLIRNHFRLAARMLSYWLRLVDWDGKLLKDRIPWQSAKSRKPAEILTLQWQTRQTLLAELRSIPQGRWIDTEAFLDALIDEQMWLIHFEGVSQDHHDLQHVRTDLHQSLCTVLNWIGIVRIADATGSDCSSFCISNFGSRFLQAKKTDTERPIPEAETQFLVLANLEIILPPDLDPAVRFRLCQFSEVRGSHCVLTRDSIRRSLDNDWTADSMKKFLVTHARSDVPDNVATFITDVADRHGHIVIQAGRRLVETRDAWLMTEIRTRRAIGPYLTEPDTPRTTRITPGKDPRRLLILLRKAGYYPRWVS